MRMLNRNKDTETSGVDLLLTVEEAKEISEKLDILLSPESKQDRFQGNDEVHKHQLVIVVPQHNNIEELYNLGTWVKYAPIYPKDTNQP
jgi:hypothetical protein